MIAGMAVLTLGADALVRGASRLARRLGMSSLLVGLTVVALGTSMPEIAVSVGSALLGDGGVALGNAVGSNIFNILVVLGGSAAIRPLLVDRQLVRQDVPVMVATAVLMLLLSLDGRLSRLDGAVLLTLGIAYTVLLVIVGMKAQDEADPEEPVPSRGPASIPAQLAWIAAGMGALILGARLLVGGAETVARGLGVSELIIGLTVVAAGTSLPELATSFVAAARGERDLAAGNVVGSNIFNALLVLGIGAAIMGGDGIPVPLGIRTFDLPLLLAVSVACLPIFFTGWSISRWEGWVFLAYYAAYLAHVILEQTQHEAQAGLRAMLVFFALPMTALTLGILVTREVRRRRTRST